MSEGADEQVARDCILLGKRLETERTLQFDEEMGTALQLAAMKKFAKVGNEAELKHLGERYSQSQTDTAWVNNVLPFLTEKRYAEYLDQALAESEDAAFEKLASAFGGSSK